MSYKVPFVDFAAQYNQHKEEYDYVIADVIQRGDLILRQDLEEFERNLAQILDVKHVVGVASGTDALLLSLKAAGVGPGDDVITCSYTFRATIEAIIHAGANPVLVDVGEDWRDYRTERTTAVIPAHLEGAVVDWKAEDIVMIEDSCQAIGAKPLTGLTACYSFYPAKILGCLGDGGAIATNDDHVANTLRQLRNHDKGQWGRVAYNSRLDNLQAAFLSVKLKYLDEILLRRMEIADTYDEGVKTVKKPVKRGVYQDYIIQVPDRDALAAFLEDAGIQTMKNGYPFPRGIEKKPKAVAYEENSLRIPCNETLTNEQVEYVIEKINEYYD